jgi:hypothetical protein
LFILVGNYILEIPFTELRYWLILFSCTCFANMLGLNISASFNSAVTIYILIPILIIPQLLLSGVVISFDKFNPRVGKPVGIPVMGEVMASRWAFEAYMVTQFKDNPFERQFYELDKTAAQAEYKRVYFLPRLESKLAYCLNHRPSWRNSRDANVVNALDILRNEIGYELQMIGPDKFKEVDKLAIGKFDSTVYVKTSAFLKTLKQYYTQRLNRASAAKDTLEESLTKSPEQAAVFKTFHDTFVNDAVSDAVKNMTSADRIVEYDGKLIQKIYPIYMDEHRPSHLFDFSANLYQPTKHFAGVHFDTLYFNIAVIWSMTLFLFVTLYFDALKSLIKLLEGNRKYKKRDRH